MSRTRKMSLRTRMLVMLVGVTTVLLLIMGTVSTYLLALRVDSEIAQANTHLTAWAKASAALTLPTLDDQQATNPGPYAIVRIPIRQPGAIAVSSRYLSSLTGQLQQAVQRGLARTPAAALREQAQHAQDGVLTAASTCRQFPCLDGPTFNPSSRILAVSVWVGPASGRNAGGGYILVVGEWASNDAGQVRGFIIAELITGAALIALLALAGEWLIGRSLEPLDDMTATANEITTRGDLSARMPETDDQTEVGKLGYSINLMLDRIQQAFGSRLHSEQKVREFAADASHELRTPLTTIRGYAELYRQGALGPDQLQGAMRRIEQEAERMSTLVAELLELARLDRTSSLDLTESDLAGIVRDAVADAIAVEPQRPVRAEAPPRLVAVVDEARIRQVLANLLGNVRAHTPVSTPVAVRLGQITGGVLIEVADAGPGMSAQDATRAFDRFHRAAERPAGEAGHQDQDRNVASLATVPRSAAATWPAGGASSAEPGRPAAAGLNGHRKDGHSGSYGRAERTSGSGLGLSIVQAIANAHGGRATLESRPGQGTKVRIWLPVRTVP